MPEWTNSGADREQSLQKAFDEAARDLDVKLEAPVDYANEPVGALIACVPGLPITKVEPAPDPDKAGPADEVEIRELIRRWESVSPADVVEVWSELAPSTAMALTPRWIGAVDAEMIRVGIQSDSFKEQEERYPPYDPRHVTIDNVSICFISPTQTAATYRFEEEYQNGKVYAANSVMVLMKDASKRWKVAFYTKHTFDHDLQFVRES